MNKLRRPLSFLLAIAAAMPAVAAAQELPAPDSVEFCTAVQKILANTDMGGTNTVFTVLGDYGASKPTVDPLTTYQVVSYKGNLPVMVSCKIKTAAHLRAVHGDNAAGEQRFCPDVTRLLQAQAVARLRATDGAAADRAAAFVVDDNEPYATGRSYLGDFQLSYAGEDGAVHFNSPGLFQDYDAWFTWILPERLQGQSYCHFPTVEYMEALATGAMQPPLDVVFDDTLVVSPPR